MTLITISQTNTFHITFCLKLTLHLSKDISSHFSHPWLSLFTIFYALTLSWIIIPPWLIQILIFPDHLYYNHSSSSSSHLSSSTHITFPPRFRTNTFHVILVPSSCIPSSHTLDLFRFLRTYIYLGIYHSSISDTALFLFRLHTDTKIQANLCSNSF